MGQLKNYELYYSFTCRSLGYQNMKDMIQTSLDKDQDKASKRSFCSGCIKDN